ncbi:MAG: amino acid adenylation domain-containing protein, partial [Caldilineaceae bacterium]|nr:amino acid adenylation domain-containing protein [Caldilineaceae bacterium]
LNQQANRLAHALKAQAIGVGQRVAICVERSPEMLVAILAVLKSGAAYVPVDPDYPTERLAYLFDDAQVTLLLTQSHLAGQLPTGNLPVYLVDQTAHYADQPSYNPVATVGPNDPIYQIYTSGSTGLPKGVVVSHIGVANTVQAIAQTIELAAGDRMLQFVPFSFDAAALEFFATLSCGATLVLHPNPTRLTANELYTLCQDEQITVVNFTVALWQQWVDNLADQGLRFPDHLRVFLVGGDKPTAQALCTWAQLADHPIIFLCSYGPTEASITTTIYVTTNEEVRRHPPTTITLGHPLPNTAIYILDAHQQLAPIGVAGELYIGGIGVAQGYWRRPELTEERFLTSLPALQQTLAAPSLMRKGAMPPHMMGNSPQGMRFYRTGDLARWLPDGRCEFVGRVDTQVKIRGFRVELGEIETQLKQLPIVREAVVMALEFGGQDKRIVAYVQPADAEIQQSSVAAALQKSLPSHMWPSAWVMMAEWPLTPNGKLDRAALPAPALRDQSETFVAPTTQLEIELAAIWQSVLHIEAISVTSNFFDLGGHSLLATQVAARIQQKLGVALPLRTFFEKPTIAELTSELMAVQPGGEQPPLLPVDRNAALPLSFAQQRLWLIAQLDPDSSGYSIPGALRLSGRLDVTALHQALNELVARHESLRTVFALQDGEPVQVVQTAIPLSLIHVDLYHLPQAEREAEAQGRAAAAMLEPFDLAEGPLLRATLFQLADDEAILFVLMHHIIADGWSIPILLGEVAELYRAHVERRAHRLPSLIIQYADYAHWQRSWLQGTRLQEQIDYWRHELAGAPPLLELPTDYVRPAQPTFQADTLTFSLDAQLVQGLTNLGREHGATLYMVVFSTFAIILARYSRQQELVIGSPIANRTNAAVEGLIGFFVNTLALRVDLSGNPSFVELLQRVRQHMLSAYAHQDAPIEQVIEALNLPRNLSHAPLFQVLLAWQSSADHDAVIDLPALTLAPVAWQKPTIEFDLALSVAEDDGELAVTWQYSTDLFSRQTMAQMMGHFQTLLATIVEQPSQSIATLPLFSPTELAQIVAAGTGSELPEAADLCLHYLFEWQALRAPEAPAIFYQTQVISYGELNAMANRLAHALLEEGHGQGERIAIYLERSPQMVAAILAILKCGAAYLPLDVDYPAERLAYLLADSGATLLVTEASLVGQLPPTDVPIRQLLPSAVAEQPTTNPPITVKASDPFYQIYTSGSTGLPKGVVAAHKGVANTIQATTLCIGMTP